MDAEVETSWVGFLATPRSTCKRACSALAVALGAGLRPHDSKRHILYWPTLNLLTPSQREDGRCAQ